ncbi:MAG TPA: ATP-dependent sacrificial sulfur transferase LarE [Syntrophales bacterium]|nr:ATP-dependent sacrificial sulfur transferase LarE [Syntrophales bacterium]
MDKYKSLINYFNDIGPCAVALSGGADSAFLLHAAREALGENLLAITAVFPYTLNRDSQAAESVALHLGVRWKKLFLPFPRALAMNPENRCYICKKTMMEAITVDARAEGFATVVDGTRFDDEEKRRPGTVALRELGIQSPLRDCAVERAAVRRFLSLSGLDAVASRSDTCLLTRLPFGTAVDFEALRTIEAAEDLLLDLGFRDVRVRKHGPLARIEVRREDREKLFSGPVEAALLEKLRESVYDRITVDLEGYRET